MNSHQERQASDPLVLGVDYIIEDGLWIFTHAYHVKRGYCCRNGCQYCPYEDRNQTASEDSQSRAAANEDCSSCGEAFHCQPGNCWCDQLHLTRQALLEMQSRFDRCLCPNCLQAVANKFT